MIHDLKSWPEYFRHVSDGSKTFEIRRNDRGFKVGDMLNLREWKQELEEYTGRFAVRKITHIMRAIHKNEMGLAPGFCIMSIQPA